jgi:putative intracellular protease/amidase/DNA-directed RNA polymerase subunit RPC12/RpoP
MKSAITVLLSVVVGSILLVAFVTTSGGAPAKEYVCPPCGAPCDTLSFDKPGACPKCGMALVEKGSAEAAPPAGPKVAILIFDGAEIIDWTGPYEMFGAAGFDVYTVAQTQAPITTAMGMVVTPKHSFADAPQPDVLLIPGGGVKATQEDPTTIAWIRSMAAHTRYTMSVCNGAFILAQTGLLDGLTATTTAGNVAPMKKQFPKVHVVDDQRVVDNGSIVTTGGLSAGIDGALHVIAKMKGTGTAQQVALYQEYTWRPEAKATRWAALAFRQLPDVNLRDFGTWEVVSTQGNEDHWEMVLHWSYKGSAPEAMGRIGHTLEDEGKWTPVNKAGSGPGTERQWTFRGNDDKPWKAALRYDAVAGASDQYTAVLKVNRNG